MSFVVYETTADNFQQSYDAIDPDIVILDIVTEDIQGFEMLKFLKDCRSNAVILLLTRRGEWYSRLAEYLSLATKLHISGTLIKPFMPSELQDALEGIQLQYLSSKRNARKSSGVVW